jgi:hypothetical protein
VFVFYLVCCVFWLGLILCNLHFAENKLTGKQTCIAIVLGIIPFVNTLCILMAVFVAYEMAEEEANKQ